jgi:hypothetical protein
MMVFLIMLMAVLAAFQFVMVCADIFRPTRFTYALLNVTIMAMCVALLAWVPS